MIHRKKNQTLKYINLDYTLRIACVLQKCLLSSGQNPVRMNEAEKLKATWEIPGESKVVLFQKGGNSHPGSCLPPQLHDGL